MESILKTSFIDFRNQNILGFSHFTAVCTVAPFLLPKCELSLDTLDETEKLSKVMLQFSTNHISRHLV